MSELHEINDAELDMVSGGGGTFVVVDLGQHNFAAVQQLAVAKASGTFSAAEAANISYIAQANV
jgi:hypothetical protein